MGRIERFEDIGAWQRARDLTREVYRLSNRGSFAKDFALRDQLRRAAVSIMANIAEGYERGGDREFQQFLSTAKASAAEVRSHLYVALDPQFLTEAEFIDLKSNTEQIARMISNFIRYLKQSKLRGSKFKPLDAEESTARSRKRNVSNSRDNE